MQYQPLEFRDFHGGITDNFIDAPFHQYEKADNYLITVNKKLYTRPGSVINDDDNPVIVPAQRIGALIDHYGTLLTVSSAKVYHTPLLVWETLQGPTTNDVLTGATGSSRINWSDWNRHTFIGNDDFAPVMKIYKDNVGDLQVRSAGLPKLATDPTLATTLVGTNNYIYSFVYYYEYTVGTVTFNDFGAVTNVQILLTAEPNTAAPIATINISNIPVIANLTSFNWDTTAIKVRIYRTQNNGTTLTYIGEVTNGTTTYADTATDSDIVDNANIYTTGGQLENDPVPLCKCLHITDTIGFYGHIKTASGEILSNRVRQSIPEDPDSCPETLYVDLDDSIVGISSAGQTPVVFCEKSIYRLDGAYDSTGGGSLVAQEIESTVGCVSLNSIVQIQRGICFASETGFYFTDGWEVRKLSNNFNDSYKNLTITDGQRENIYGTFDRNDKRVWWAVQETTSLELPVNNDVNKCYILDTRYGLGEALNDLETLQGVFTTASNGEDFKPTAILFKDGDLLRADSRGYTFRHNREYTNDPLVNTAAIPSLWSLKTIPWDFKSMATSFGSSLRRKFCPKVTITADNNTNITIQVNSINDIGRQSRSMKPIRSRKNWIWGDFILEWGVGTEVWNFRGLVEEERRFFSDSLRCSYKQIQITNAFDFVIDSDSLGTATIDPVAKTLTLDNIVLGSLTAPPALPAEGDKYLVIAVATGDWTGEEGRIATWDSVGVVWRFSDAFIWPSDCVGQFVYFEVDGYTRGFEITVRADDVLTYVDATDLTILGTTKWTIKGFSKSEVLDLISFSLWFAYLGGPADFNAGNAGGNPS